MCEIMSAMCEIMSEMCEIMSAMCAMCELPERGARRGIRPIRSNSSIHIFHPTKRAVVRLGS